MPIELDNLVQDAGGRTPEDFPRSATQPSLGSGPAGGRTILGLPGRFLLRLINVLPDRCPPEERTKFYLMALTVLLNAAVAGYTVPTGLSVAYPALHGPARAGLALVGAGVVGVMDALIVGYWVSAAAYRLNPPDRPPPLPGPLKRFSVFIPRLAFTGIIVFGLGLLLTLSANKGVIAKQLAINSIKDRNAAIAAAQTLDDKTISADTVKLGAAQLELNAAQLQQTADENRASCELYGRPPVPGCSGNAGYGPVYRHFEKVANGSDQVAVTSLQNEVNSLQQEISTARADRLREESNKDVFRAAAEPAGLSGVRAAWDEYADSHGFDWVDRYLMDLLILGVDIVPLGMKLFSGVSSYEAIAWEREWDDAVATKNRRQAEHKRLSVYAEFYNGAADIWRETRLRKVQAWLEADADDPGEIPRPPVIVASPQPDMAPAGHRPFEPPPVHRIPSSRRHDDDANPIREHRDAQVGDVVQLALGRYKLLAQITTRESYNCDAFIAALIRSPGQVAVVGRDVPLRAVKFSRQGAGPSPAELDFVNRFPAPGETLLRTLPKLTAHNRRIVYESPYFPRSDVQRYFYGDPRSHYPRLTVGQVIKIMRSVNDAHRRIWEEDFLHNDTRLRNLIMSGPLEDGRENPVMLSPRGFRDDQVMLCDWGSMSYVGEPFDTFASVVASVLESDPAVLRVLLGFDDPLGANQSPLSFASDQYGTFACAYQLLTGCISPTEGQLIYRYENDRYDVAYLETVTYAELVKSQLNGWPDALVNDPLPVHELNPNVPLSLARLVDAGLRANPLEREPRILGINPPPRPRDVANQLEEAIDHVAAGLTKAELDQVLPARHEKYLWQLEEPVGWPADVLDYVEQHWPEYGDGDEA